MPASDTTGDDYDIKAALQRTSLSHARAAKFIGVWDTTVDDWCAGTAVPKYARTILDLYENCPDARARLEAQHPRKKASK